MVRLPDGAKFLKIFIRFDRIHERDRRTDRRADTACSLLFSSAYTLVRGFLCRKQTCTVTVIHQWTDHRQFIALAPAGIDR